MKILVSVFFLISAISAQAALTEQTCKQYWDYIVGHNQIPAKYQSLIGKCDDDFRQNLRRIISTNIDLGYTDARKVMFGIIDNDAGEVCGVYSGICIRTSGIPNGSVMNCEHTWPQSRGASGIAKSDLHHLYPADSKINSRRSNYEFCEVENARWAQYGSAFGTDADGKTCFEPRIEHKGNLARSLAYFAVRYGKNISKTEEYFVKKWNTEDPVDEVEQERNKQIFKYQGNMNPFVEVPDFMFLISDY